ncbi:MAG TPA: type II toxin-antitoxin system VapC family toxin [Candidatus Aenigmarchaeota archaeon]|nr:type II toxin-antitoxin system VapC family toxin [Candidatus Aenigmarchaeota archaeon]
MKYLIDTDWVIDHFNRVEKVTKKLEELAPEGLALSIISLAELYEGVYYSRDPSESERVLKEFLASDLEVLGIDEETCKIFGRERGRLRREGKIISDFDLLIASTCLRHNLILLTNNRRHYELVEGLEIISV